ncbi:MAG: hypothetical protein WA610_08985 [Thermodesulfovibrionales bacterium]
MTYNRIFFGVAALVLLIVAALYTVTQDRVLWYDGHPYDSDEYYRMALQVAAGSTISVGKPFGYRVAAPTIVGRFFPDNIMAGFLGLNLFFGLAILVITALLFYRCFRSHWTIVISLALLIANPHGPVRFTKFFPVFTDAGALFFIIAILYVGISLRPTPWIVVSILGFVGVFFREIVLIAPLSLLFGSLWRVFKDHEGAGVSLRLVSPVLSAAAGIGVTHLLVQPLGEYTFSSHALFSLTRHIQHPSILLAAPLTVYGPVILLLLIRARQTTAFFTRHPELACYACLIGMLAVFGGTHTDRFFFWAFPALLPAVGVVTEEWIRERGWSIRIAVLLIPLVLAQVLAFRAFHQLPNSNFNSLDNPGRPGLVLFAPYGEGLTLAQMHAAFMSAMQRRIVLIEYGSLLVWLLLAGRALQALPQKHAVLTKK